MCLVQEGTNTGKQGGEGKQASLGKSRTLGASGGGTGTAAAGGNSGVGRATVGVTSLGGGRGHGGRSTLTVELVTLDGTVAVQLDKGSTAQLTGGGQVESTSNLGQGWERTVVETANKVNRTTDGGQVGEEGEVGQLVVLDNVKSTANVAQRREVELGQLAVFVD